MNKHLLNNFAFIDSQNLNLGIQSLGWKLNYKRFRIYLKEKYKAKKAFLRKFVPNIAFMNTLKEKLKYKKSP